MDQKETSQTSFMSCWKKKSRKRIPKRLLALEVGDL